MSAGFPSFESREVRLDGVSVRYLVGGRGRPLVLVHGLGSSAGIEFYYNLEALATGHRVLAVDLPGFGMSDKPDIEYSIPFFVRTLHEFLRALQLDRVSLGGVSLGGRIALGFALEVPVSVERLVLVDALGLGTPRRMLAYTVLVTRGLGELALRGTARALRQMDPRLIRRLWGWYLSRPQPVGQVLSDDRLDSHRQMLSTPAYRAAYLSALRSIADRRRLREGVTLEDRLGELAMPTLLIWGRHDHLFPPAHAEAASRRIPDARLVVFEGSGHTPQMEEPARFNALVLEFLAERSAV